MDADVIEFDNGHHTVKSICEEILADLPDEIAVIVYKRELGFRVYTAGIKERTKLIGALEILKHDLLIDDE